MIKRSVLSKGVITKLLGDTKFVRTLAGCLNSLPAKSVLAGTKLVLFGRYVLKFYVGIVQ
jgi:hypothetical protein